MLHTFYDFNSLDSRAMYLLVTFIQTVASGCERKVTIRVQIILFAEKQLISMTRAIDAITYLYGVKFSLGSSHNYTVSR